MKKLLSLSLILLALLSFTNTATGQRLTEEERVEITQWVKINYKDPKLKKVSVVTVRTAAEAEFGNKNMAQKAGTMYFRWAKDGWKAALNFIDGVSGKANPNPKSIAKSNKSMRAGTSGGNGSSRGTRNAVKKYSKGRNKTDATSGNSRQKAAAREKNTAKMLKASRNQRRRD